MYREVVKGKLACKDCLKSFPVPYFQHHTGIDGKLRPGSYCRECKRKRGKKDAAKSRYGLSKEAFLKLEAEYPTCAICGSPETFIDHNHTTGKVRGRLCRKCNTGLGMFLESNDLLQKASDYLTRFSKLDIN